MSRAPGLIRILERAKRREIRRAQRIVRSLQNNKLDLSKAIHVFVEIVDLMDQLNLSDAPGGEKAWLRADRRLDEMAVRVLMHIEHEWSRWLGLSSDDIPGDSRELWQWFHQLYRETSISDGAAYQDNTERRARLARTGKRLIKEWPQLRRAARHFVADHNAKYPESEDAT